MWNDGEKGKVIENKNLYWDWEYKMRKNSTARRPDLRLEDGEKKVITIIDMACPNESHKDEKRREKIRKYQQLCFELRERREDFTVKVVPSVISCLGSGLKRLKEDIKELFTDDKELECTCGEMQKSVIWESETIMRKILLGLIR